MTETAVCSNCGRDSLPLRSREECGTCVAYRLNHGGEARPAEMPPTRGDRPDGQMTTPKVCKATGLTTGTSTTEPGAA